MTEDYIDMSIYLVHGFRWTRRLVYEHIANYDVEEASPEWVQTGTSSGDALRDSITHLYPTLMESLDSHESDIIFIEQHGDGERHGYKQPWVYVCDQVEKLEGLSLDIGEVASQWGLGDGPTERFEKLRDQLEADAKIGLWIVLCSIDNEAMSILSRNSIAGKASNYEEQAPPIPSKDKGREPAQASSIKHVPGEPYDPDTTSSSIPKDRSIGHDKPLPTIPPDLTMPSEEFDPDPSLPKANSSLSPLRSLFRMRGRGQAGSNM